MASFSQQMGSRAPPHGGYAMPVAPPSSSAPAGTFQPGTKIQVGSHRVVIQKYLSEGGFAHVYVVKMPKPIDGTDLAVLKRVAVPDKEALRGMRTEVETMKRLKGHRMIVTYIDSHASELKGGGYEVFLLMEYCGGGGLIDFMNTRLQHRLTEPEILDIFCDIAEGVACMHYLKPSLLHRDLKIENVLITNRVTSRGSKKRFKLCDFGSSAPPRPAPTSVVECRLMDEDVQKHTTLQYRSPEMVDVYRKQPLNEKADIWALGVFLYKLCYYTTPFEDQGQLAILNASYKFPPQPPFSDRLKRLIASMLKENLQSRPNIYQVLKEACAMQGRDVPVQDIYSGKNKTESSSQSKASSKDKPLPTPQPAVGAVWAPPKEEKSKIPEVTPMRRGRPTASPGPSQASQHQKPAKATGGDPFAALDSKSPSAGASDDISSRFPSLEQFSLLHDQGSKFDFDSTSAVTQTKEAFEKKTTEAPAKETLAASRSPPIAQPEQLQRPQSVAPVSAASRVVSQHVEALSRNASGSPKQDVSRASSIIASNPDLQAISSNTTAKYVSTGTSTSDLPFEQLPKPAYRVSQVQTSEAPRSSSLPRQPSYNIPQERSGDMRPPSIAPRVVSSYQAQTTHARAPSTSRESAEVRRPQEDLLDVTPRNTLNISRSRPVSGNFETTTTMDYLREREALSRPASRLSSRQPSHGPSPSLIPVDDDTQPEADNLEFLRSMEESDGSKAHKRSSMGSISGGKGMLTTKFGDAFKRFEGNQSSSGRTPSPLKDGPPDMVPLSEPEVPDARNNDAIFQEDADEMSPEMRREMERMKLEEEEQRVEAAQAEYRRRVATGGASATGPPTAPKPGSIPTRASTIQNRVQSLLDEQKTTSVPKTATGYGKYSDAAATSAKPTPLDKPLPDIKRKPITAVKPQPATGSNTGSSAPPALPSKPTGNKPVAPKKPMHLNSLPTGSSSKQASPIKTSSQPLPQQPTTEQLIAVDLPGQPTLDMTAQEKDNYLEDFSQRFPSLSAMESGRAGR